MASPFAATYNEQVRPKLDLIDELQVALEEPDRTDIPFPCIAVVGNQSSGKSSVLERMSGVDLPRCDGTCTRVPLVLSIKRDAVAQQMMLSYNKSDGKPVKKVANDVEAAIKKATEDLAGGGNDIKDVPISLNIAGPDLPDLRLVDLPGIVYSARGNQSKTISKDVKELIHKYIEPKETIILCVFAGDTDFQTSEALELAKRVDPDLKRTIGVVTKVDKAESYPILKSALLQEGSHDMGIKLELVAVINRSANERDAKMSGAALMEKEQALLRGILTGVPENQLGMPALVKRLCELQLDNLISFFPGVRDALSLKVQQTEAELDKTWIPQTPAESFKHLRRKYDSLLKMLKELIKLNYEDLRERGLSLEDQQEFHIFPRIEAIMKELQHDLSAARPKVFGKREEAEIRKAVKQASGRHLPNFLPPEIFGNLMKQWFAPYEKVVEKAKTDSIDCINGIIGSCTKLVMPSELFDIVQDNLCECLGDQFESVDEKTANMLEEEKDICNTNNNYYTVTYRKVQRALAKDNEMLPDDEDSDEEDARPYGSEGGDDEQAEEDQTSKTQMPGMTPARSWLANKLRVKKATAKKLQMLQASHNPEDMKVMEMQLSAFCYDKVRRKRLCDDLMKIVRHNLLNFIEEDKESSLRRALDDIDRDQVHDRMTSKSVQEKQHRQHLEAKLAKYQDLLGRIDQAGGATTVAAQTKNWASWGEQRAKRKTRSDPVAPAQIKRAKQ